MKNPGTTAQRQCPGTVQAAASQYPELKGLLMRSARGDTSTNLSVGIFSSAAAAISMA